MTNTQELPVCGDSGLAKNGLYGTAVLDGPM